MNIGSIIDHTILRPDTTLPEVRQVCAEAVQYGFASVCIPPCYVAAAADLLRNKTPRVCTVIGFPFGYSATVAKMAEMEAALQQGAHELDLVLNGAALKNGDLAFLEAELHQVSAITQRAQKVLKVIIESGSLTDDEIITCCKLLARFPVQFAKTSTGYAKNGASVEAVQLMRRHLPSTIQIKASGGIKSYAFARELVEAGATRLGCSASVAIVNGAAAGADY